MYDKFVKEGYVRDNGFKDRMLKFFQQPGVYEHGRIGHKDLLREYAKSAIFAYPCSYAGEINCIALTKAIASGCMPVTNDKYVMVERNPFAVSDGNFKNTLVETLKGNRGVGVDEKLYIQENSWESVARDWSVRLFP